MDYESCVPPARRSRAWREASRSRVAGPFAWLVAWLVAVGATATPLAAQGFVEEAQARGVNEFIVGGSAGLYFGTGVLFGDLDRDGDADLVTTGSNGGHVAVYENDGEGFFVDRNAGNVEIGIASTTSSLCAADIDADGDLDLYLGLSLAPNRVYRNDGDFQFTLLAATGLENAGATMGCAFGDVNRDGLVDLYVANRNSTANSMVDNELYVNLGNGTFSPSGAFYGVNDPGAPTYQAVFLDLEFDGDLDLYLSTDKGYTPGTNNRLFEFEFGRFFEITEDSGTAANFDSMGVAIADWDGNKLLDIYCTNTAGGNALFSQDSAGRFSDTTNQHGVNSFALGWGALALDYDNDARQDLYVCNIFVPNRLYANQGAGLWEDRAAALGLEEFTQSYCIAAADIEGDGDVDFVLSNFGEPLKLWVNHVGELKSWVRFDIESDDATFGVAGAGVRLRNGVDWQASQVHLGSNFKSQNETTLAFGLDDAEHIDEVVVSWPGGTLRTLTNLPARQRWSLVHPARLGDADRDGDVDFEDRLAFHAARSRFVAEGFVPGFEEMDFDGDSDVDADDLDAFLTLYALDPDRPTTTLGALKSTPLPPGPPLTWP